MRVQGFRVQAFRLGVGCRLPGFRVGGNVDGCLLGG